MLSNGTVILAKNSYIEVADLPPKSLTLAHSAQPGKSLGEINENHVLNILGETDRNYSKAARILGISRVTLHNKIRAYGLDVKKIDSS